MCAIKEPMYEMHIGETTFMVDNSFVHGPEVKIEIGEDVLNFIERYSDVIIQSNGNKSYKINKMEFTIHPKFD